MYVDPEELHGNDASSTCIEDDDMPLVIRNEENLILLHIRQTNDKSEE